jgi:ubiquinone/menaquinone biosynthesis C-methylase UbiE
MDLKFESIIEFSLTRLCLLSIKNIMTLRIKLEQHLHNDFFFKLQEFFIEKGYKKNMPSLLQYVDVKADDVILDVGGNTGKITNLYSGNSKKIFVLEPEHKNLRFGMKRRKHIGFVEGEAGRMPFLSEYFDKVVILLSFHHIHDQDTALQEINRVLKASGRLIMLELDPSFRLGKCIMFYENTIRHMGCKFYCPLELKNKIEKHGFQKVFVKSAPRGYFLIASK